MEPIMQTAEAYKMSANDYLAWEALQKEKHEFVLGETFAMGGARREHVIVSLNIAAALKQHLRGTPCHAYISDMKLQIEQIDAYYYPDVMVSCAQNDQKAEQALTQPSLIIEVLSDSTEAYDRGEKFAAYRQVLSLKEYVLIDIKSRRVECFRRTTDSDWLFHDYSKEAVCHLSSVEADIPLADIFEDID